MQIKPSHDKQPGPFKLTPVCMAACAFLIIHAADLQARTSETTAAFTATQLVRQFTLKNTVTQAVQGLQAFVADHNGSPRGSAMAAPGSNFPVDMGSVPAGLGVPQRDGAGRPLGYCAWDSTTATTGGGYLGGMGMGTPLLYAVVSSGINGSLETSCADIASSRTASGDDYIEFKLPNMTASQQYRSPVATAGDLPATAQEGDVRLVLADNKLYSYIGGTWAPISGGAAGSFADDSATNGAGAISYTTGKVTVADFQATVATFTSNLSVGGTSTFTGAMTANNGVTIAAGGLTVTGATAITGNATVSGSVTAGSFIGGGGGLTDLNASNINAGVLGVAYGGTGVNAAAAANGALLIGNGSGFALGTLTSGPGILITNGAGSITVENTGVTSIAGTINQINVSGSTGAVTLSLPQAIATTSTPTFGGLFLNGALSGATATFTGAVSASRLNVGDAENNVVVGTGAFPAPDPTSARNVVVGHEAMFGASDEYTEANVVMGTGALRGALNPYENTVIGDRALQNATASDWNVAIGALSMFSGGDAGDGNVAVGYATMYNHGGNYNTALGYAALETASGSYNTAVGDRSLQAGLGASNTALGRYAGWANAAGDSTNANTTGSNNTYLGAYAMPGTTAQLNYSTAIGSDSRVTTSNTVVLGRTTDTTVIGATGAATGGILQNKILQVTGNAGISGNLEIGGTFTATSFSGNGSGLTNLNASNVSSGTLGVAYGGTGITTTPTNGQLLIGNGTAYSLGTIAGTANQVLVSNGAGSITLGLPQNIATTSSPTFGGMALNGALTGTSANFSGGVTALRLNISDGTGVTNANMAVGTGALAGAQSGSGRNLAVGVSALNANTSGDDNVAVGYEALLLNTTATNNTAVGSQALRSTTSGDENAAFGHQSLFRNTTGYHNVALGSSAMEFNTEGFANVAIGQNALLNNTTGDRNIAIGRDSLSSAVTRNDNVGIGHRTLSSLTSGAENLALGVYAGYQDASSSITNALTSGSNNTFLGSYSTPGTTSSISYATAIGSNSKITTSNTVVLGRTTDTTVIGATGTASSGILQNKILQVTGNAGISGTLDLGGALAGTSATFSGTTTLAVGTTTVAPLRFQSGTNLTTPVFGAVEFDGTALYITNNSGSPTRKTIAYTDSTLTGNTSGSSGSVNTTADNSTNATRYIAFLNSVSGTQTPSTDTALTYNPSTDTLTAGIFSGNGASLTALNAANISSGTLAVARGGTGVTATPTNGQLLIGNGTAYTLGTLTGTANQVSVTNASGSITLSLPQNIATTSTPTFGGMTLNGALAGTSASFSGDVTARRLIVSDSTGVDTANIAIGSSNLVGAQSGSGANVAVGELALNANTSGSYNAAFGGGVLRSNTTGFSNTAIGVGAMFFNTTGSGNAAIGVGAMAVNTTGLNNTSVGSYSLPNTTTGEGNVSLGYSAGTLNVTGSRNTLLGSYTDVVSDALSYATALGSESEVSTSNTVVLGRTTDSTVIGATGTASSGVLQNKNLQVTGSLGVSANIEIGGTFTGTRIAVNDTTGGLTYGNTIVGPSIMVGAQSGTGGSVAVGEFALNANTSGYYNAAFGGSALRSNTTGHENTAIGVAAMFYNTTGNENTALGRRSMLFNDTGYRNTALGFESMFYTTSGYQNVAVGDRSLRSNTTGIQNVAMGSGALYSNVNGNENIGIGEGALYNNIDGHQNIAVGDDALELNTTGGGNVAIGADALAVNTSGAENVGIGDDALNANTTGFDSVAIGRRALYLATTGNTNTALGNEAGYRTAGGSSTNATIDGTYMTFLGAHAMQGSTSTLSYGTAVGADSRVTTSNTVVLGRTSDTVVIGATGAASSGVLNGGTLQVTGTIRTTGNIYMNGSLVSTSDYRLKNTISQLDTDEVLRKLAQMKSYSYRLNLDPKQEMRIGVVAQEVAALFPEVSRLQDSGYYGVDYGALGALAAAGVGRLSVQFDTLNKTVTEQGKDIATIKTRLDDVDTRVTQLEGWKTEAVDRMDKMQSAIDLNIEKIAANALAIASNTEKITTLEQVTQQIDSRLLTAEGTLAKVDSNWNNSFTRSDDGQTLTVKTPNLIASNFTAEQVRARAAYTERLEAEMARIRMLEVDSLRANTAVARNVQAETVNTGSAQVYAGVGNPAFLFAAPADGHYTVNTSALDGSYATATVIVNAGQAKVVKVASEGIELIAEGNAVKAVAAGKAIRASWIKMG